jgi:hypothetical protein
MDRRQGGPAGAFLLHHVQDVAARRIGSTRCRAAFGCSSGFALKPPLLRSPFPRRNKPLHFSVCRYTRFVSLASPSRIKPVTPHPVFNQRGKS